MFAETIYPVFARRTEHFAPGTDWWGIVAGDYHTATAQARFYDALANDERVQDGCAATKETK